MSSHARRAGFLSTAASIFIAAWCASTPAHAQTPAPSADSDAIIVTAQKRAQNVLDVGISVQTLSASQLGDQRIEQIRDLPAAIPNLDVKEQVPGAIPVVTIRGVGLDDFSSTNNPAAGIYVDEVPLSSLALMNFDLYDMQRVEVLRGPQGTLYGRNTTAGALNLLSATPVDHFEARLFGGYGNYERGEAEAMLNLPLGHDAAMRFSLRTVQQGEGFWKSRLLPGDTIGQQNIWEGRAQLAFAPTSNIHVNLKVEGERSRSEMGQGEFFGSVNFITGAPPNFTCAPILAGHIDNSQCTDFLGYTDTDHKPFLGDWAKDSPYDITEGGATARVTADLGFAQLTSVTGYIDFSRNFYIDSDASRFREFEFNQIDAVHQFTQEFRLAGSANRLDWLMGAFYSRDHVNVRTPSYLDDLFATEAVIRADQVGQSYAGFAHAEYALAPDLKLVGGLRYTHESKDYVGGTRDLNPFGVSRLINPLCPSPSAPCQISFLDKSISDDFWSWQIGLNWRPDANTLFYASASRGQKSGGFFSGIALTTAQLLPYRPEQLTSYEVGVKEQMGHHLRAEASLFYYDYVDLQTFIRVTVGPISVQALGNVPTARVEGADLSLYWQPINGLTLQGGLGLLNTRLGAFSTTAGPVAAGNKLPNAADLTFNGRAIYEWGLGGGFVARAQAGAQYSDGVFKDALNDPVIAAEPYWLYDARLSLTSEAGDWEAALWVQNIANEEHVVQGLDSGLGAGNRTYNAPRTFGISLSRNFQ